MKRCPVAVLAVMLCFAAANRAWAADGDAAKEGGRIAREVCSRCHQVEPGAVSAPGSSPPSFQWIANNHPEYLSGVLLRPPHPMLGVVIRDQDVAGLRAYFATLRQPDKSRRQQ